MNCQDAQARLDHYIDAQAMGAEVDGEVTAHLLHCPACTAEQQSRQALRAALKTLPVPEPSRDFFRQAVVQAVTAGAERQPAPLRRRGDQAPSRAHPNLLHGLAAVLLVGVLLGALLLSSRSAVTPETGLPGIELIAGTVTPIKLAFSTEKALTDARLSLNLPVGVELVGYDGRTDISWNTSLEAGTNVLRLPLVGRTAASEVLTATIDHPSGSRVFQLEVTVKETEQSSSE